MPDALDAFQAFDLAAQPAIVAAVSGGSDSTALLILLNRYIESLARKPRLVAVTVDHALRPGSAAEAAAVARLAEGLGVPHRIVTWAGSKPVTGLASAARNARYHLLAQAATAEGATMIMTGHTGDDQVETVAMRGARGDGRGMAGMAPATLLHGRIWIARPFLSTRRESLRDLLRNSDVSWIDDPTNANLDYERPRVRVALGRSHARVDEVLGDVRSAAAARQVLGRRAAALISRTASTPAPGLVCLARDFAGDADQHAAVYALRILLAVLGGTSHLPDGPRALALLLRIARPPFRATLSRTMVESRADGIYLLRERRSLPASQDARHGMIWDGRFRVLQASGAADAVVLAHASVATPADAAATVPARLIRAARSTLPLLEFGGMVPAPGWSTTPLMAPWADFLPSFDLAPATALATLIGATLPPAPPFAHHNVGSA